MSDKTKSPEASSQSNPYRVVANDSGGGFHVADTRSNWTSLRRDLNLEEANFEVAFRWEAEVQFGQGAGMVAQSMATPAAEEPDEDIDALYAVYETVRDALACPSSERLPDIIHHVMLAALQHLAEEDAMDNAIDYLVAEGMDSEAAADDVCCVERIDRIGEAVAAAIDATDIHGLRLAEMVDMSVEALLRAAGHVAEDLCPKCDRVVTVGTPNERN